MPLSKIRDLSLSFIIIACLCLLIYWLNSKSENQGGTGEMIRGNVKIVDADSFFIGSQEIRLFGVDAPEGKQFCETLEEKKYPCGRQSSRALQTLIKNKPIKCQVQAWDRYHRAVSICYLKNTDINDWLVRQGLAIAYRKYSHDYIEAEQEAKKEKRGMWQGHFLEPWQWRSIHNPR